MIRRKAIAALTLAAALTTLGACNGGNEPIKGNGTPTDKTSSAPTATPKAGPDVKVGENDIDWCQNVKVSQFKQTGQYTPTQVADAYCELVTFNGRDGLTSLAIPTKDYDPLQISIVRDSLTNTAYKSIQDNFKKATAALAAGKPGGDAQENVSLLTALSAVSSGYGFANENKLAASRNWSTADYSVATSKDKESGLDRLYFKITFTDDLLLKKGDRTFTVPKIRHLEIFMSPTSDDKGPHSWLIDGWKGKTTYGKEKAYKEPVK